VNNIKVFDENFEELSRPYILIYIMKSKVLDFISPIPMSFYPKQIHEKIKKIEERKKDLENYILISVNISLVLNYYY